MLCTRMFTGLKYIRKDSWHKNKYMPHNIRQLFTLLWKIYILNTICI